MEFLPCEIKEHILFYTSGNSLLSLCLSSRVFYYICEKDLFWKKKFKMENTPLLEEGKNTQEWLNVYLHSRLTLFNTYEFMERFIPSSYLFNISLRKLSTPHVLFLPSIPDGIIMDHWSSAWKKEDKLLKKEKKLGKLIRKKDVLILKSHLSIDKLYLFRDDYLSILEDIEDIEDDIRDLKDSAYMEIYLDDKGEYSYILNDPLVSRATYNISKEEVKLLIFRLYYYDLI